MYGQNNSAGDISLPNIVVFSNSPTILCHLVQYTCC
jgi:hypothetical protein